MPLTSWDDPEYREQRAPFTVDWPGLAASQDTPLTPAEQQQALNVTLPKIRQAHQATSDARLGLIAAARPADVLAVIGWGTMYPRGGPCCR